jgi:hypothetical protein
MYDKENSLCKSCLEVGKQIFIAFNNQEKTEEGREFNFQNYHMKIFKLFQQKKPTNKLESISYSKE